MDWIIEQAVKDKAEEHRQTLKRNAYSNLIEQFNSANQDESFGDHDSDPSGVMFDGVMYNTKINRPTIEAAQELVHQYNVGSLTPAETKLHGLVSLYLKEAESGSANQETLNDLEVKIKAARKEADNWYTQSESLVDRNGKPISPVADKNVTGGYLMTKEEYEEALKNHEENKLTFGDNIKQMYNNHNLSKYISDVKGNEFVEIVLNDVWAQDKLKRAGYHSTGETTLGKTYKVHYGYLAENIDVVTNDGTIFNDRRENTQNLKYDSSEGYFGLLEFDEEQAKLGAKGDWGDVEHYVEGKDLSRNFIQNLKTYRSERKKLIADQYALNRMYLLNEDPASRLDGPLENTADFFHNLGETIVEATGNIFMDDYEFTPQYQSRQSDLNNLGGISTYQITQDAKSGEDKIVYNNMELTEKMKDETKTNIVYDVAMGVGAFLPAIVEFAAIESMTGGLGTAVAFSKFGTRLGMFTKKSMDAFAKANNLKVGSPQFWKTAQQFGMSGRAGGLELTTQGKTMYQTAKLLNEELKMGIVMGDDYHVGSGAAFYGVGAGLNKLIRPTQSSGANSLLNFFKSGSSGMLGIKASEEVHGLIEHMKGNESYQKHLDDNYSDLSEVGRQMLTDFFVFSLVGYKGTIDKKGGVMLGFRGLGDYKLPFGKVWKGLATLNKDAQDIVKNKRAKQQELLDSVGAKEPSDLNASQRREYNRLESESMKYLELYAGTKGRMEIMKNAAMKTSSEALEKHLNERYKHVTKEVDKVFNKSGESKPTKFEVVENEMFMRDPNAGAEFEMLDGRMKIRVNREKAKLDQIPQEIGHLILAKEFSGGGGRKAAENFKLKIKDSLKGLTIRTTLKNRNGDFINEKGEVLKREKYETDYQFELAKVEKELSLEDYITNEYGSSTDAKGRNNFHEIKAEEFIMNALEMLASRKNRDKVLGGRILDRFSRVIDKELVDRGWKPGEFNKNMKGKELVKWMGDFAMDMAKGKVTSRQIEQFRELLRDPILDQHVNSVGPTAIHRHNSKNRQSKAETPFIEMKRGKKSNEDVAAENRRLTKNWVKGKPEEIAAKIRELKSQAENLVRNKPDGWKEKFEKVVPELKALENINKTKSDLLANNMGLLMNWLYGKGKEKGVIKEHLIEDAKQKEAIEKSAVVEANLIINRYDPAKDPEFGRYFLGALRGKTGLQKLGDVLKGADINLNRRYKHESIDDINIRRQIEGGSDLGTVEGLENRRRQEKELQQEMSILRTLKLPVSQGGFGLSKKQVERVEERLTNRDWYKEDLITVDNVAKDIISEVMGNTITEKVAWAIKGNNWEVIRDAVSEQSFEIARPDLAHRVGADGSVRMSTKLKGTVVRDMFQDKGETVTLKREGSTQNLPKQTKREFTKETFLRDVLLTTIGPDGKPVSINADSALGKRRKKAFNNIQHEMGRGLSIQIAKDVIKKGVASGDIVIKTTLQDLLKKVQDGKSKALSSKAQELQIEKLISTRGKQNVDRALVAMQESGVSKETQEQFVRDVLKNIHKEIEVASNTVAKKDIVKIEEFLSGKQGVKFLNELAAKEGLDLLIRNDVAFGSNSWFIDSNNMKGLYKFLNEYLPGVRPEAQNYFFSMLMNTAGIRNTLEYSSGLNRKNLIDLFGGKSKDGWDLTNNFVSENIFGVTRSNKTVKKDVAAAVVLPVEKFKSDIRKIMDSFPKETAPEAKAEAVFEFINDFYKNMGTTFADAYKANKNYRADLAGTLHDYVYKGGPKELINERLNEVYNLTKLQSMIGDGLFRGLNPLTAFTISEGKFSNQHVTASLNHNINMLASMIKSRGNKNKFVEEFRRLDANSDIAFNTEAQQKINDRKIVEDGKTISGKTTSEFGAFTRINRNIFNATELKHLRENFIITPEGKLMSLGEAISAEYGTGKVKVVSSKSLNAQIEMVQAMREQAGVSKRPKKGISVWDFDDTLAKTKSNVLFTRPDGTKGKLNAEQYAKHYVDLANKGYKFDFSEFSKVMQGEKGPLFNKAVARNEKFGNEHVYILTARPSNSNRAIHEFLKGVGLDIKLENIVGLGNSTAEAKASWMVKKVSEGYNDFYFADDAMANVKKVKEVLEQFDIKSKTQLAIENRSSKVTKSFAEMIERRGGVKAKTKISKDEATLLGQGKNRFEFFVPSSAEDFGGLMYKLIGKGKQGEKDMAFLKKNLFDPYEVGIRDLNRAKQKISIEFDLLKKEHPEVVAKLKQNIPGMKHYTYEHAVRSFLFEGAGHKVESQSKSDRKKLNEVVTKDPELLAFASNLSKISMQKDGYTKPQKDWLGNGIQQDLLSATARGNRGTYLKRWIANKNRIFNESNINRLKALHGEKYVEALENMLWRMENGVNRNKGEDRFVDFASNAMSNSVGAIMFMNIRSATLQMLSTANFVNWGHNNILNVGKTLANPKQYWSDVAMIFNSNWAKQRRSGLKTDVNHVDLANSTNGKANKPRAALNWLIQKGFMPTQIADSFAISLGGASYFRNTVKKNIKEGMTKKKAEEAAWLEFQGLAEKTQQSSRPDLISQQQASGLGRFILAFANTPMQYNRIIKKSFLDLKNGRGSIKENVSKIVYYGAMQNFIFSALQAGLFSIMFGDEDKEAINQKEIRIANSMMDTILRGSGFAGAGVAALKNMILEFKKQDAKGYNADHVRTVLRGLSISPPLSSRIRKVYSGLTNYKFQKGVIDEMDKTDIDNPMYNIIGNVVEGMTNVPLSRLINKAGNVKESLSGEHEMWKSIALLMGWNKWDLGIENKKLEEAKSIVKQRNKEAGKVKAKHTRTVNKIKKEVQETGGWPGHDPFILPNGEVHWVNVDDQKNFMSFYPEAEIIN